MELEPDMLRDLAILCKHGIKIHRRAKFTGIADRNFLEGQIQSRERPRLMYKNYYKRLSQTYALYLLQQIYTHTPNMQQNTENSPLKSVFYEDRGVSSK